MDVECLKARMRQQLGSLVRGSRHILSTPDSTQLLHTLISTQLTLRHTSLPAGLAALYQTIEHHRVWQATWSRASSPVRPAAVRQRIPTSPRMRWTAMAALETTQRRQRRARTSTRLPPLPFPPQLSSVRRFASARVEAVMAGATPRRGASSRRGRRGKRGRLQKLPPPPLHSNRRRQMRHSRPTHYQQQR